MPAKQAAPLAPNPVIMTCLGHCGIGIGAESYRWTLLDVGADPKEPTLRGEKEQLRVLRRYGATLLRFGASLRRGEVPLIPRALLIDLDPRSANLILQSYPELFAMRDKHALYGLGGAARNWAEGRSRFRDEIAMKYDIPERLEALSPEHARGFLMPFAMGGGTGGSFASAFMEFIRSRGGKTEVLTTYGILPEFGYDPVIYGPAHVSIVMNLAYQILHADCPILVENEMLRRYADQFGDRLAKRSSIVDELPKELEISWNEYRNMNLISAHVLSSFVASFARETEWDISNYRTWLASSKPRFAVPWMVPLAPRESSLPGVSRGISDFKTIESAFEQGDDGLLFSFETDGKEAKPGEKDSCCIIVKVRGAFTREEREYLKSMIKEKFPIQDRRMIFIRVPCLEGEAASACILVSTKAVASKIMALVKEAEEVWDGYEHEYTRWALPKEEFKQSVVKVVGHFS